mmetsp:Transcript_6314/g.7959  ORF Transcript_6314/g.7959 Transcript_6314/m.7959 type:complete len:433 (+) Transcript_6314:299-1597(+)|eukprot:CAMPEP_0204829984 /NCGR_PEP_ID=MMETSP1346-20131115/8257_1 /ASSEMBLY_ACC=CAM_ASM_000771 /TAXON_ID=215587 /ORGANISM="Aplanochytrium stocchinoi, Strain GSBS06" /LENGTH=432 /DNA_ID=CAMNT_0051960085 /DNA_START=355 /DNA_END=1653 /DNA_ORIENTATION=-
MEGHSVVPARLEITVSDPMKQGEGMNAYVSYKVNTKTDLPEYEQTHFSVIRRYSDFLWLAGELQNAYPGVIIPPLPEKHVVGRLSENFYSDERREKEEKHFLAERRRSLQKFLTRIAVHGMLRDSTYFKAFLEQDPSEFSKTKERSKTTRKSKGFWQWASETSHTIQSKLGTPSDRPKTEEDEKFEQIAKYINGLEPQTAAVHKHAHGLVKRSRDMVQSLYNVGVAFTLLGQTESGSLGSALGQLGQCADKLSVVASVEADKESQFFEEPLKDYVRMLGSVKQTLETRTKKQVTYETALADLNLKKANLARISGIPGKEDKRSEAETEVNQALEKVDNAKEEFDTVTQRVFEEVDRFKREKLRDFKSIILDYVQLQIEYNQQVEKTWRDVLPTLQALNVKNQEPVESGAMTSAEAESVPAGADPPEPQQAAS